MAKKAKAAKARKPSTAAKAAKAGARRPKAASSARSTKGRARSAKAPKKSAKTAKAARRGSATKAAKARPAGAARKAPARKPAAKAPAKAAAGRAKAAKAPTPAPRRAPTLDRERRTVQEEVHGVPSSLDLDRSASSVRTGRFEYEEKLRNHTSTGPAMTGGDVDADWEDAESVGEEAPGGDNPTPDQDVVDEIGRAVGIEYDDDEELQGGDEVAERDRHRWELDPRSREDREDEE